MAFRFGAFVLLTLGIVAYGQEIRKKKYCEVADPLASFHAYSAVSLNHQFLELNDLVTEFKQYNFTILGFPVNQFNLQEPAENDEILACLREVRPGNGFVPNFEIFEKGDANGVQQTDIWSYLKDNCASADESLGVSTSLFWDPFHNDDIRWTFSERIILDVDGFGYIRYNDPTDPYAPGGLRDDIEQYLRDGYIDL
ncbi:glutathione peroxidase 3-like [Saccoglossus kowalevskii]|uniref:glutathione peroxidase n=1 Tax=Saccoglossus kowalevskii TaxID=10224 RepID=A0ABM0MB42_SACKO|nr:PREDICTED: glutathione peroxidase 3-like [Saccoglossus kowalevskii]